MVGDILQPTHLLFVLAVALLVLGPKRLPEVGRTLGAGIRDFRQALSGESISQHSDDHQRYVEPAPPPVPQPTTMAVAEPIVATATPAAHFEPEQVTYAEPVPPPTAPAYAEPTDAQPAPVSTIVMDTAPTEQPPGLVLAPEPAAEDASPGTPPSAAPSPDTAA